MKDELEQLQSDKARILQKNKELSADLKHLKSQFVELRGRTEFLPHNAESLMSDDENKLVQSLQHSMTLLNDDNFRLQELLNRSEETTTELTFKLNKLKEELSKKPKSRKEEEDEIMTCNRLIDKNLRDVHSRDKQIEELKSVLNQTQQD